MPKHSERRFLPYGAAQMFDLVADIERYPEFLPWCLGVRVTRREAGTVEADMLVGLGSLRRRFGSRVVLSRADWRIDVRNTHGPFRYLVNGWRFESRAGGCDVDFFVDFEFRSGLLRRLMEALFAEAVHRMVRAFENRAKQIYGDPTSTVEPRPGGPRLAQAAGRAGAKDA